MPKLISFQDAVDASVLNPNATHAVYYMDGHFQNERAVRARCPHAKLFAITVLGATGHGIFACDSENGDLTIPQTVSWVDTQVHLGVDPVVVYANQDRWLNLGLLNLLARFHDRIERWDADFDGVASLPSWASAKQFRSTNVDEDIALANFFGDAKPRPAPRGRANFVGSLDFDSGHWHAHGIPGTFRGEPPEEWWSAEIQVDAKTGHWRIRGIPKNSKPLGG